MNIENLFESELQRRGIRFKIDSESERYSLEVEGNKFLVSLNNLKRDVKIDNNYDRIPRFIDSILISSDIKLSSDQMYWSLEPNDYKESATYRVPISDLVDRVLVHLSTDHRVITWVTSDMLITLGLSEVQASDIAFRNLAKVLSNSKIEFSVIHGVNLGFIDTSIPFKSSLILAPNLRECAEGLLGWPLMAVVPDRDFLYLWAARHAEFASKVGHVVVREYSQASYPISTEVYEISEDEIKAIGHFAASVKNKS